MRTLIPGIVSVSGCKLVECMRLESRPQKRKTAYLALILIAPCNGCQLSPAHGVVELVKGKGQADAQIFRRFPLRRGQLVQQGCITWATSC